MQGERAREALYAEPLLLKPSIALQLLELRWSHALAAENFRRLAQLLQQPRIADSASRQRRRAALLGAGCGSDLEVDATRDRLNLDRCIRERLAGVRWHGVARQLERDRTCIFPDQRLRQAQR